MSSPSARLSRLRRGRRGQAAVETAVLCIVLVPLILYALFLDDLLRFKLDLGEAVFAAPWDYTTLNYEDPGAYLAGKGGTSPQHNIRLGLCDHTSAYNSYDGKYECVDSVHHVALSAHECWMVPGAQQVACGLADSKVGTEQLGMALTTGIKDQVKKNKDDQEHQPGGQITCNARLAVINYYLPQKVLQKFSKVDTTRTQEKSGDVHAHYASLHDVDGSNTYILETQQFSVVTDTWAMTTVEDVDPDKNEKLLYKRVNSAYPMPLALMAFVQFPIQAVSNQLLSPIAIVDASNFGDMIITPQVGFSTGAPPSTNDFYSSEWEDKGNDPVKDSHDDRGNHYMGRDNIPN